MPTSVWPPSLFQCPLVNIIISTYFIRYYVLILFFIPLSTFLCLYYRYILEFRHYFYLFLILLSVLFLSVEIFQLRTNIQILGMDSLSFCDWLAPLPFLNTYLQFYLTLSALLSLTMKYLSECSEQFFFSSTINSTPLVLMIVLCLMMLYFPYILSVHKKEYSL